MLDSLVSCAPWLVWMLPAFSSLLVPLASKLGTKVRDFFVILIGTVTLILAVSMVPGVYQGSPKSPGGIGWIPIINIQLGVFLDPLSILFTNLIALIGLVVLAYSLSYMVREEGLTRYYFFMLLFIGSMIGLVIADNFLQMFIFWELVGMCSYALVSFWYKRPEAVKAGLKVFLMTKVGDVALLAGILIIYAELHTLSYQQVFERYGAITMPILTATSMLMLFGATVKSAQLPLHSWLYSAMEAPTSVSCLLHGAAMVKAGVYLIARTHVMFCGIPLWLNSAAWIGAVTALIGATLALHTSDIKGVAAYSTVSQIGFMITALGAASSPQSLGWFAGLFHMLSHAFFQGLGFLAIGSIIHQLGTRDMMKMGGLRRDMPITFALCLIVILARSGIPPFCGFFSKGLIASSLLSTGNIVLILLIYFAAAITFAYSYRFLVITFAGGKSQYLKRLEVHEAPRLMSMSSGALAVGTLILGFLGGPLVRFLGTNFAFDFASFFSLESLMFMLTLFIGGFPVYLVYQRKIVSSDALRRGVLGLLDKTLGSGFFFDHIYEAIVNGFLRFSNGLHGIVEVKILERVPPLTGNGVIKGAQATHQYLDASLDKLCYFVAGGAVWASLITLKIFDATLDKLVHLLAEVTALHSLKVKKMHTGALPHFVLATVLGFLFLCILLLLTLR